ncbi:MAG: riboflavin kinase [Candidatus Latescibacterota bacterium]|nr:riboflavin kinase [Candidatus Latescibacterota bacterium]
MTTLVNYISVNGTVIQGKKRGRELGVRTANIEVSDALVNSDLTFGVYAVKISVETGKAYYGVANFGVKPTFSSNTTSLEVHLFDFNGDLYGRNVSVEFRRFIRPEICFDNSSHLKEQILKDLSLVREYFSNESNHLLTED